MDAAKAVGSNAAKLIVLNTCWAALVAWAFVQGYVTFVFTHDVSGISYVIAGVLAAVLAAMFLGHTRVMPHAKGWFVMLGLIGNLIGFVLALQGMQAGSLGDAAGLLKLATSLIDGMSVAFCSTLVGAVAALWISTNSYVLQMAAGE